MRNITEYSGEIWQSLEKNGSALSDSNTDISSLLSALKVFFIGL